MILGERGVDSLIREVNIAPDDFNDFLVIRNTLLDLRKRYGDPCFFIQFRNRSFGEEGAERIGFEEVVRGRLGAGPHAPVRTRFGFTPDGDLDEEPGRRVEVSWPDFAIANEFVGAMFSTRFDFFAVAMFAFNRSDIREVALDLEAPRDLNEFNRRLFARFPTVVSSNTENDLWLWTSDPELVRTIVNDGEKNRDPFPKASRSPDP